MSGTATERAARVRAKQALVTRLRAGGHLVAADAPLVEGLGDVPAVVRAAHRQQRALTPNPAPQPYASAIKARRAAGELPPAPAVHQGSEPPQIYTRALHAQRQAAGIIPSVPNRGSGPPRPYSIALAEQERRRVADTTPARPHGLGGPVITEEEN